MLSARGSRELRAAAFAMKLVARDVSKAINRETRQVMNPVWCAEVARRATTGLDKRVLNTGVRVAPGNPPSLIAANSTRRLRGGLVPAEKWHAVEFGANQANVTTYDRTSRRGTTHKVTRHTSKQLPARTSRGRVVFPAVAALAPRLASLWVQTIVRMIHEAAEKGE